MAYNVEKRATELAMRGVDWEIADRIISTESRAAELYEQDLYAADAAVIIAREHGFNNVRMSDCEDIEVAGGALVATFGVVWLDACGDEAHTLALLNMEIDNHADWDAQDESAASTLYEAQYDLEMFEKVAQLFTY